MSSFSLCGGADDGYLGIGYGTLPEAERDDVLCEKQWRIGAGRDRRRRRRRNMAAEVTRRKNKLIVLFFQLSVH